MKPVTLAVIVFALGVGLSMAWNGSGSETGVRDANAATEDADLEVQSVTVDAPESATVSVPFNITVTATLRNNGPSGPVDAPVDFTLSTPADCVREPESPFETVTTSLGTGAAVPASVTWSVTCNGAGVREFRGTVTALSGSDDVYVDRNSDNNFGEGTISVSVASAPTSQSAAEGLPSSGGRPPDSSGSWFPGYLAVIAAISAAVLALALGAAYARKRWLR